MVALNKKQDLYLGAEALDKQIFNLADLYVRHADQIAAFQTRLEDYDRIKKLPSGISGGVIDIKKGYFMDIVRMRKEMVLAYQQLQIKFDQVQTFVRNWVNENTQFNEPKHIETNIIEFKKRDSGSIELGKLLNEQWQYCETIIHEVKLKQGQVLRLATKVHRELKSSITTCLEGGFNG